MTVVAAAGNLETDVETHQSGSQNDAKHPTRNATRASPHLFKTAKPRNWAWYLNGTAELVLRGHGPYCTLSIALVLPEKALAESEDAS